MPGVVLPAAADPAGEPLFSTDRAAVLDRLHRRAKAQPYRADATPSIYEQVVSLADADGVYERLIPVYQHLQPVDTTSPRTTLNGFRESLNRAYALVMEADAALSAEPPTMSKQEARVLERKASRLLQRAVDALDLPHTGQKNGALSVGWRLGRNFLRCISSCCRGPTPISGSGR